MGSLRRSAIWALVLHVACIGARADAREADDSKAVLPVAFGERFMFPSGSKDQYGSSVVERSGVRVCPTSRYAYEIWLREPRMEFVLVPSGELRMGSDFARRGERPAHTVHVPAFYIAKYETTNRQWQDFVDAGPQWRKSQIKKANSDSNYLKLWKGSYYRPGKAKEPVCYVSWFAVKAYCEWVGGRLPTEAEWEKAARGSDARTYPWGNEWDRTKCNCSAHWAKQDLPDHDAWKAACLDAMTLTPVGSFPSDASPYGVLDLGGNVHEWTSSLYLPYPYGPLDGREDPNDLHGYRVWRGGSCASYDGMCRASSRFPTSPSKCHPAIGFRVCVPITDAK